MSSKTKVPKAPDPLPRGLRDPEERLVRAWFAFPKRAKVARNVALRWHAMIKKWSKDKKMPLFVRRKANELGGCRLRHPMWPAGIVHCDNSPAQWVMRQCLEETYNKRKHWSYSELKKRVLRKAFPVRVAHTKAAKKNRHFRFRSTLRKDEGINDQLDYHTAHIVPVRLRGRRRFELIALSELQLHFLRLLSPANMALVPMKLRGIGDLACFQELAYKKAASLVGKDVMIELNDDPEG